MRNVKRLWGVIGCLSVCILLLAILLIARSPIQPETPVPSSSPDQQNEKKDERVMAIIGNRQITLSELHTALVSQYGRELLGQMVDREAVHLEGIEAGIEITDAEIERELKRMQQGYESEEQFYESMKQQLGMSETALKADVRYKLLLERIATKNIFISDEEVDTYIAEHSDEFKPDVELYIQQIILSSREQANKVIAELNKGEDFAILARDRSLDDATANNGGELGWVLEDDPFVMDAVMNAAKQLEVNEFSKPIAIEQGFLIVRLKDRKTVPNPEAPFVRENVRRELALHDALPLKDIVVQLRNKWNADIKDPEMK
ncbi:peptidylprolyl isomerase [Paenibacillus eucommiae]|uniref:peptidylprolyl isomerase n=1 Tax=Paenibacillus eucommiae TaxID=1355755 RepID=A0ABS4JA61_9BACL|nr:peptidylprolyl isomerase [Paenibacillus eucommiae]MBP1996151.1 foldase protein PrsA [Paenibacillus eucommiae]